MQGLDIDDDDGGNVGRLQPPAQLGPPSGAHVLMAVKFDSIYSDSLAEVTMVAASAFSVSIAGPIAQLTIGKEESQGQVGAVEKDGAYRAQFQVFGWIREMETSTGSDAGGPHRSYGMRFFPFVSAIFSCHVRCSLPITHTLLDVPDALRFVWYLLHAVTPDGADLTHLTQIKHSPSGDRSRYILVWPPVLQQEHSYTWPIRVGGLLLLRAVYLPMYYGLIALAAIVVASFQSTNLALGAVIASWVFLLRHWIALAPPQKNTLLGHLYTGGGVALATWCIAWVMYKWYALTILVLILPVLVLLGIETRRFEYTARLRWLERWWTTRVRKADAKQDAAALATRSLPVAADHQKASSRRLDSSSKDSAK